jgi:hypothetical protein
VCRSEHPPCDSRQNGRECSRRVGCSWPLGGRRCLLWDTQDEFFTFRTARSDSSRFKASRRARRWVSVRLGTMSVLISSSLRPAWRSPSTTARALLTPPSACDRAHDSAAVSDTNGDLRGCRPRPVSLLHARRPDRRAARQSPQTEKQDDQIGIRNSPGPRVRGRAHCTTDQFELGVVSRRPPIQTEWICRVFLMSVSGFAFSTSRSARFPG